MGTTCDHSVNVLLPWYVNGSLGRQEKEAVARHLAECSICRAEREILAQFSDAFAREESPAPALELASGGASRGRTRRYGLWAAAAAALLLVAVGATGVGWMTLRQAPPSERAAAYPTLLLDLGVGPLRSDADLPRLTIPDGIHTAVLRFVPPAEPKARHFVRLLGPDGGPLASGEVREPRDSGGGFSFGCPASAFSQQGEYAIEVTSVAEAGGESRYLFPFMATR